MYKIFYIVEVATGKKYLYMLQPTQNLKSHSEETFLPPQPLRPVQVLFSPMEPGWLIVGKA